MGIKLLPLSQPLECGTFCGPENPGEVKVTGRTQEIRQPITPEARCGAQSGLIVKAAGQWHRFKDDGRFDISSNKKNHGNTIIMYTRAGPFRFVGSHSRPEREKEKVLNAGHLAPGFAICREPSHVLRWNRYGGIRPSEVQKTSKFTKCTWQMPSTTLESSVFQIC